MKRWPVFILGFVIGAIVGVAGLLAWAALMLRVHRSVGHASVPMTSSSIASNSGSAPQGDARLVALLEPIRKKYALPGLGCAIADSGAITASAVVGVRAMGEASAAGTGDVWHLGSDTKAMTATMIAALVEQGRLSWDTTLSSVYPDVRMPGRAGEITLLQLLTHRGGLPPNTDWNAISGSGSLVEQRRVAVGRLASTELLSDPGAKFSYSNWGYVVAGAMAEKVTGKSYESLMQAIVFGPLHMGTAGFGAPGTPGKVDEPWGHSANGIPSQADNPLVMAPAGCAHCSLSDWGKFISDQLRGSEGKPALLNAASYARLHSPPDGGSYSLGWGVADRAWGGGKVLTHAGSNTRNLAVAWMAPARDFAMLVVCNQGGSEQACNEVVEKLVAFQPRSAVP